MQPPQTHFGVKVALRTKSATSGVVLTMMLGSCGTNDGEAIGYKSQIAVAQQMLESGQVERGYRLLDDVTRENASSGPAQIVLGNAYLAGDAFLKAELAFTRAIDNGQAVDGRLGLGRVALARNRADEARRHFQEVLQRNPRNLSAINGIGVSHDLDGNHHLAVLEYRKVLEIDPADAAALNNLGLSFALAGNGEEATRILSDLAGSALSDTVVRQNLAVAYMVTGRQQEGLQLASTDISTERAEALGSAVIRYRRGRP
jgi:Flp pilus assembly protein TadD